MPLDTEKFRRVACDRIEKSGSHCGEWHQAARDDYDFVAGNQWTDADRAVLEAEERPIVVFNYSEKMIDAVSGAEVNNRQEVTYKARRLDVGGFAEMMTNAKKWQEDESFAEDEDTDAFRDALITGMGWTGTSMDYAEKPDGMVTRSRIDPIEMRWDPAAVKPGLADRRWDAQGVWMDNDIIPIRWPEAYARDDSGKGYSDNTDGSMMHIKTGDRYNSDNQVDDEEEKHPDQTLVWSYQCVENEIFYRVDNGQGGIEFVDEQTYAKIKDALQRVGLKSVRGWRRVYYHAFLTGGDDQRLLSFAKSPYQEGFTRQCITGKRDRNANQWYGLTRVMKDPQRWANKWLAQIMHIINSNAKGGLLAEFGAFQDPTKAQADWSSPDKVIFLNEGGINKIKEKQMAAYPAGLAQLMEFALSSLPQVTGINLEALGLADRDQANVLEQSRKQAAYGLLAPIFDSLKRYRKNIGAIWYSFIQQFISDGRLVRVTGPGTEQFVPLLKQPDGFCYDIVVDQSPTAPDVKSQTWNTLMQLVPAMLKAGMPIPPQLLAYAPIPTELANQWMQFIQQMQQQGQVSPEQVQQMQQQMQQLSEENQKLKTDNSNKMVEAQSKRDQMAMEMAIKKWVAEQEMQLKALETRAQLGMQAAEIDGKMELQTRQQQADAQIQEKTTNAQLENAKKTTEGGLRIKAAQSGVKSGKDGEVKMKMDNTEVVDALNKVTTTFSSALDQIVKNMNRPKKVVRDKKSGAVIGVE